MAVSAKDAEDILDIQTMTYNAPTPQLWLNLNKFEEVSTATESCRKVHLAQMFILCVYVCVCVLPPNYEYPSPIFKCLLYTAL